MRDESEQDPEARLAGLDRVACAILRAIATSPGIATSALTRSIGLSRGAVRHHLAVLERRAMIARTRTSSATRYFPASVRVDASRLRALELRSSPSRGRILSALGEGRALSQAELAHETGMSVRLVSHHLKRLLAAGLVVIERTYPRRYSVSR